VIRPSASSLFVVGAIAIVVAVGALSQRAGARTSEFDGLPSDIETYGFVKKSEANGVALLDATREFRLGLGNGPVHGVAPRPARAAETKAIVTRELARYPRALLERVKLKGVVFADDLAEGENPIPSLPNVGGLLLLDVGSAERDLVRVFHHEIYHFVDLADDGALTPDPAWDALNARGFAYGAGGRTLRAAWAAKSADDLAGFVSGYATSAVEEDKAETFAFAVARPDTLRARLAEDPVLAAKAREIARRVGALDDSAPAALGLAR
jgi:hypothetical protein